MVGISMRISYWKVTLNAVQRLGGSSPIWTFHNDVQYSFQELRRIDIVQYLAEHGVTLHTLILTIDPVSD